MRALSAFFTDSCHDAEFLVQFTRKTLLWSFSVLDLASLETPRNQQVSPQEIVVQAKQSRSFE